jgi:ABC-2 type transport system permease protein
VIARLVDDSLLLASLRWRLAWNTFRSRKLILKIVTLVGMTAIVLWAGGFSGAVGLGAGWVLSRFPQLELEPLLPGLILTGVTVLLLVSSFGVSLGSLFLSNDLDLLMTAPVDRRAVFITKILDGMATYYVMALVSSAPAMLTYGLGLGYGPLYYVLAMLAILATPLLPAAIGALLVMLVARFAPARRVREVMGLAAAVFGVACSVFGNTSRFWARFGDGRPANGGLALEPLLEAARRLGDLPIPSIVAGKGLAAAGTGDLAGALVNLSGYLILTVGTFALGVWLADSLYAAGWVRMQGSGSASRSRQRSAQQAARGGMLGGAAPPLAIALKDWRVIPRDLRNFAQFLTPLFLLPVLYLNFFGGRRGGMNLVDQANSFGQGQVSFTNAFVAAGILFTTSMIFTRIASTGISMEGKSYWLMKAAPISNRELLLGKFTSALVPFAILSTILFFSLAVWRGFSLPGMVYGWFGILLLGAGMLANDVGMSVPWANLNWDDPRRMSSGVGAFIAFVVSMGMALSAGLLLAGPLLARALVPDLELAAWIVCPILATVVVAAVAGSMLIIGLKFLSRVGEA